MGWSGMEWNLLLARHIISCQIISFKNALVEKDGTEWNGMKFKGMERNGI